MVATLRLGTRGSLLARTQSSWVADRLRSGGQTVELVEISTHGDRSRDPIAAGSEQGVFTKEIQRAILDRRVDFAVHSLKDLPTERVEGIALVAIPERADPRDALLTADGRPLSELPHAARIATGSLRRRAQLLHARPDLEIVGIRGNVDTRIRKLAAGEFDGVVLAVAGLTRLGYEDRIAEVLSPELMLPAVGQGALGIECRDDDATTGAAVGLLNHDDSSAAVRAERALLRNLQGGCLAPIGALAEVAGDTLHLTAAVLSGDGRQRLARSARGEPSDAEQIGTRVAEELLADGAGELLAR